MQKQTAEPSFSRVDYLQIQKLEQRIQILEEKVFKKVQRIRATEAQKFLLAYYSGALKQIIELNISQNSKDLLVSVMLDIDPDNARKYLSELGKKNKQL